MKQKILIKVSMSGQKCRSKAMKIAVGVAGVDSAALKGDDKTQIEVVGEGVDVVCLATLLRKNIGYAELVSVTVVKPEEKKDDKKDGAAAAKTTEPLPVMWSYGGGRGAPIFHVQEIRDNRYDPCSIM